CSTFGSISCERTWMTGRKFIGSSNFCCKSRIAYGLIARPVIREKDKNSVVQLSFRLEIINQSTHILIQFVYHRRVHSHLFIPFYFFFPAAVIPISQGGIHFRQLRCWWQQP